MAADPKHYPAPSPALSVVTGHITTLVSCQTTAKTRVSGAVAARDAAAQVVSARALADMHGLAGYVEVLCNADPPNASTLATGVGMFLRKLGPHSKPPMQVKQPVSATAHVVAKAVKGARAYDWQYSVDGGKTWVNVPTNTKANVVITGMQTNVMTQFRYRAITRAGVQDWSEVFSSFVL